MIYFILWIFLGNYVLLNLFLAVLLDGFQVNGEISDNKKPDDLWLQENQQPGKQLQTIEDEKDYKNDDTVAFEDVDCDYSVYLFSKKNKFRRE